MKLLETIAGNKAITEIAFRQLKKYISENSISLICIYLNDKKEIDTVTYKDEMVIIRKTDFEKLKLKADGKL